jgi:hypothetical protein
MYSSYISITLSPFFFKTKTITMSVRNYIQNARSDVNQNNMSCIDDQTAPFGAKQRPLSLPVILTISNFLNTPVSNFDVFGANKNIDKAGFNNGSLSISGVTISSDITDLSYQQFLYQCMQQPFCVGITYIESFSGSSSQIIQNFKLTTQDANGKQLVRIIEPIIDPYQQQSSIVAVKESFSIDAFTKLTFSAINAFAVFRIHFYPSTLINLARGFQGVSLNRGRNHL